MTHSATERMPPGIPFIVVNEFAERFCFYGINAILSIYMVDFLHFGEAQATTWQSLFKSGAYFFPLLGAVVSDVFLAKFRTIILFSLIYCAGCAVLALNSNTDTLALGLFLIAFGTGGIKPCVSTNVGDQFTAKNEHLIERAFSWFYLSINAGSLISIWLCPILLPAYGPHVAFGVPGVMMFCAIVMFWLGRARFAVVPPAGRAWLDDVLGAQGLKTITNLLVIYLFIAFFWALWDQSNGTTWTLQAQSSLMDKDLGFGLVVLPAQIQAVNALFILILAPLFSYVVYPFWEKFFKVTPLRKIGVGLFVTAASFVVVAWIEDRIQNGHVVSAWWQIFAFALLTAGEVLVSITGLEFSYRQAPLRMKSFVMALFFLSVSAGNLFTAAVNHYMVRPLTATAIETGAETWAQLSDVSRFVVGQKIDFAGNTGVEAVGADGKSATLEGTYLVAAIDRDHNRVELMSAIERQPVASRGTFDAAAARVSTYALVGPAYFLFFAAIMALAALLFIFVAMVYREHTYVREDDSTSAAAV